jgi:hypothetical protein
MELGLSQQLQLNQSLCLSQTIDFAKLMAVPDEVLSTIVGAVSYNPDVIESKIMEQKDAVSGFFDASGKVKSLYSSLIPSKGDSDGVNSGIVGAPDLRGLEGCLGQYNATTTSDVTYIGRKNDKPEIVFSDHLKGSMGLNLVQLDSSLYPETSRLLDRLRSFDQWKRDSLMKTYVVIGGKQREYMESFDKTRFNIFKQSNLADKLDFSDATVSRLISNRWVEIRSVSGEQQFTYVKDLLPTKDDLGKYIAFDALNNIMKEEFELGRAYSDAELCDRGINLARRTVAKHRKLTGVPNSVERKAAYVSGALDKAYVFE